MSHTPEAIHNADPNAPESEDLWEWFRNFTLQEVQFREARIRGIANLHTILSAEQLQHARDARAGIRHISATVHSAFEAHHEKPWHARLEALQAEIHPMQEKAEKLCRWLIRLYSDD